MLARRRRLAVLAVLALAVTMLAGCTMTVSGRAVSIYDDPFKVAGLPTTGGPSGPRPGVPDSTLTAIGGDNGEIDKLALNAIDDIQTYWRGEYHREFEGEFVPVTKLFSWTAKAPRTQETQFCKETTYHLVNAAYCRLDNTIGWDRGVLLPMMQESFGKMAVVMVLAHEYGHAIQTMSRIVSAKDEVIVKEQQADCFAGAFIRHVAEGKSRHFTINTSDGLNNVLAATVAIRDSNPGDPEAVHGSAFERVTAVQIGFTDGPKACKSIDMKDINRRRKNLPEGMRTDTGGHDQVDITKENLIKLSRQMAAIMPVPHEPTYDFHGANLKCRNGADTVPVTYCPATNTIGTDVPALAERGAAHDDERDNFPTRVTGDYDAYVVFVSRYTLAVQGNAGQRLTGAKAGLRAACLSGVISAELAEPENSPKPGDLRLTAGDLDKAVSGLLTDGLAASDVEGKTVPSGFSRVDAFRAGVLGTQQTCVSRYS
ncbi:metallopeptidase [Nocardia sp. CDC159]|uniref:Metallopeptidase n=1 Tax=Nocardia pulmonis TaxID=2951408 RepID=A0A9X2EB13_9NOCA|nr:MULTISPECIES: metallopeptidase [Nocardia]MCM6776145.1 metallopeptidase [Nocardia pulmonis]MCM6788528.1 metallopeptidase [Nocardia sp. CDC159]